MSAQNDGGPAFPTPPLPVVSGVAAGQWSTTYQPIPSAGMSLREWYAGKALQGLLSNPKICDTLLALGKLRFAGVAQDAFVYADAMLAARAKEDARHD